MKTNFRRLALQYRSFEERLRLQMAKEPGGCWIWIGATAGGKFPYGRTLVNGKLLPAHRVVYEWLKGPIESGKVLDHLCRVPSCVNPDHLEVVSQRINLMRGTGAPALNATKTHCPQGHPYDTDNTFVLRRHGRVVGRDCRACRRDSGVRRCQRNQLLKGTI